MNLRSKALVAVAALGVGGAGLWAWSSLPAAEAADHLDPPARVDPMGGGSDRNADIADLYAWHQGTGASAVMVAVLTFSGPNAAAAGQAVACDRDVLYGIHMSNDADPEAEFDIYARFGQDDEGRCMLRVQGIPGNGGMAIEGPVERELNRGGARVFAGLRDDPFFFDLTGFRETLAMSTLRFVNDRDFFARLNSSAIVVEFPLAAVSPANEVVRVWATTGRTS